mgnify:CR=1 FL=1
MINPMLHTLPPGTKLHNRYRIQEALSPNKYLVWDSQYSEPAVVTEFFPLEFDREADLGPYVAPRNENLYRAALTDFLRRGEQVRDRLEQLPSVIHVKDIFQSNRTGYIVEEYAAPPAGFLYADLAHRVAQTGPLPAEKFLPLLKPVLRDLGAAHQAGILHGKLTTDHLFLNDRGVLKLTFSFQADTLIAPQYGPEHDFVPDYIPSEVRSGEDYSPCGEVYSLCVAIYTCLTGLPPGEAWHRWSEMCGGFPTPGKLGLLPHWQDQIIMRGMDTRKDQRWRNMEELHAALYCPAWKRAAGKQFLSLWTFLKKKRGAKQVSLLHGLCAAGILSLILTGTILWQRAAAPEREPAWQSPDLLDGLTREQRALMSQGSFSDGDLSYHFPVPGIPTVTVTGYVGTGTEVTVPEEVQGFSVRGIEDRAFLGSGLKIIRLPDSLSYDPIYFPAGCTILGGKRTEDPPASGDTKLERQLRKTLGSD